MRLLFIILFHIFQIGTAFHHIQPLRTLKSDQNARFHPTVLYAELKEPEPNLAKYFVPGFVGVWAIGYSGIALQQILGYRMGNDSLNNQQLGESGGLLGVGLTVVLFIALVGYAAYEVFKPETQNP